MTRFIVHPATSPLTGTTRVPGDKSVGHRSLLFGALSSTPVTITGLSGGADNRRTRAAVEAMGVRVEDRGPETIVHGVGLDGLKAPAGDIDCGNSGTTMRLLCGLLAGQPFSSRLIGDDSLTGRPMKRVSEPLAKMGASITGEAGAKAGETYPPLVVAGVAPGARLRAIDFEMTLASAQVKSAVVLAALYADGVTRVTEPGPTRDHTEIMLAALGAPITRPQPGVVEIDPRGWSRKLACERFTVPGDPSSSAFLVVAGVLVPGSQITIEGVLINPTRVGFLEALASMGASVDIEAAPAGPGEPTATIVARGSGGLGAIELGGEVVVRAIDEMPILGVCAAFADGETVVRDAEELRVKESDRVATTVRMLRTLGVDAEERPDGFVVRGKPGAVLSTGTVHAHGDHRIAMAAAIAGLRAAGPIVIEDCDNVATSFPTFVETLRNLGARIDVE